MAHAALVSLARTLEQIQCQDQFDSLFCSKNYKESLYQNVESLLNFLEDFPEKYAPSIRSFEKDIRDAAHKLEDLIESYITLTGTVLPGLGDNEERYSLVQILDTHIGDVESLIEYVDSIMEVATKVKSICTADLSTSTHTSSSASGSSRRAPSGPEAMVGVNDDFIKIKDRVTNDELNLRFIPIFGTGGIGKTTLARNVYEDPFVEKHFDVRFWLTVTQEYHILKILQGLLPKQEPLEELVKKMSELKRKWEESVKNSTELEGKSKEWEPVEEFIELVYKSLKHRRYLIVLDDMWHGEVWDRIRRAFPDDNNGSRVIITTRLSDVAAAVDSSSTLHQMQYLNENQSWTLLREKVYGQEECPLELEEVGNIIARNCKGLPLTIVVISGLLKANKTKDYWDSVAKNINEAISTNDDDFFAMLSLSYENLPHHLKACFLYMGVFPEDHMIPIKKLVKLWVAEGFLKPARLKSLEEIAEEYLEDLVNRSLVLVTKKRSNGKIRFCSIHDVLREFSIQKGQEEKFLQHYRYGYTDKYNLAEIPNMQRRLIINTPGVDSLPDGIYESPLRSLVYFSPYTIGFTWFTSKFLLLRVVDGLKIKSKGFPDEILNLVNLRYLAFTYKYTKTCYIPAAISKLKNLETIIVKKKDIYTSRIYYLFMPSEVWKMPQLRHVVVYNMVIMPVPDCEELGESYSVLHNLKTLHVTYLEFTTEVIEGLPNLKKLRVKYPWPKPELWPMFYINNLVYLHQLEELNFELGAVGFEPNISRFPQNLKKLTLKGSRIPWEKMSIVVSMPNLEVLKLMKESFIGREWKITEEFSSLKHLEMESMDLEDWIVESDHFPCLERLIIRLCDKLKEVPESIGDITTLKKLTVKKCNLDVEESVRKLQEQQRGLGNDDLIVHIVSIPSSSDLKKKKF
ncbi:putative late blight resistance protein homolog R1A-3 [Primulina huaijiensis]|uniref:putative late blight resistance protein homolog R1A-3 n=1 Tax=Primulina huaijiensis TaxID=1492673 RepID=UPI003CC79C35